MNRVGLTRGFYHERPIIILISLIKGRILRRCARTESSMGDCQKEPLLENLAVFLISDRFGTLWRKRW